MAKRRRADELLVEASLVATKEEAARYILAGKAFHGTARIDKAGQLLPADAAVRVADRKAYVSRGGLKLERALDEFGIDIDAVVALDAGCSTGGFTDCLLRRGARRVYAVDVGYGQLAWELRGDERVAVMERTNVRNVRRADLDPPPGLVVADLAFVSLTKVIDHLAELAGPDGTLVVLVKPQFEVARSELVKGVVVDASARERALAEVVASAEAVGLRSSEPLTSPVRGADGNVEYLLALTRK